MYVIFSLGTNCYDYVYLIFGVAASRKFTSANGCYLHFIIWLCSDYYNDVVLATQILFQTSRFRESNNLMKNNKINIDWLKEDNFDEKYYTQVVFVDGTYRTIDIWTDEKDITEIETRLSPVKKLELKRYFSPHHARWINDNVHKEFNLIHIQNRARHTLHRGT